MDISANEAQQHSSGHQDQAEKKTIHFNKSYPGRLAEPARSDLTPMGRLVFDTCLELAWRIDIKGSAKWLGCLRQKGRGPYSNLQLAKAAATSPSQASRCLKALRKANLLESVVVDGERYLRVTDFPARMDGSYYQDFRCSWDEKPPHRIAQKAIVPVEKTTEVGCPKRNSEQSQDCPERNPQGDVDCSESNSSQYEIAGKAIDTGVK